MSRRHVLAGAVAAVAGVLVVASLAFARASDTKAGGTFRIATQGSGPRADAVDPAIAFGGLTRPACGSLMGYPNKSLPAGLRLTPELAAKAPSVSADRKTYTFTIRASARFSTGAPVTARDLEHSLERILDPQVDSELKEDLLDVVGARRLAAGKATTLSGVTAKGRTLDVRLTRIVPDFPARTAALCAVPASLPADPEGAKAPIPSAAPYFVSEFVAGESIVMEQNPFYKGTRPQRVDRFEIDLAADPTTTFDDVTSGKVDYAPPGPWMAGRERELARRYGVNKSRYWVRPGLETHMIMLNTSRPLFRDNPELRRAVNFAVDRKALLANEFGPAALSPTDQYLPPAMPGFADVRIYPLTRPDLRRARALARGRTRSGKAVLYTCTELFCTGPAEVLKRNLRAIGIDLEVKRFPLGVYFQKLATPREPYDLARVWVFAGSYSDPGTFISLFDGRMIGRPEGGNFSYFDSVAYNGLIDRASRLSGSARYRAYGALDVRLARDAAPAIAYAYFKEHTFVSARVGCVVVNPGLDLTAVCLK